MQVLIEADEGDRISVGLYSFSQREPDFVVYLYLGSLFDDGYAECERVTLVPDQARKLARALLAAADGIAFPDELIGTN